MEKLQYISQGNTKEEQESNIRRALDAGVSWVQVRWKNAPGMELQKLCESIKLLCAEYESRCIINDHVQIAKAIDADGVHLGLDDGSVIQARVILGNGKIIGGTANTLQDILQRISEQCDYIGVGPLRYTSTKQKLSPILGFEGYELLIQSLKSKSIAIPRMYAIGGVKLEDIDLLQKTGIYGVAVSGEITSRPTIVNKIKMVLQ